MKKLLLVVALVAIATITFAGGMLDIVRFPQLSELSTSGASVVSCTNYGGPVNGYVKAVVIQPKLTSNVTFWVASMAAHGCGVEQVIYSNATHSGTGIVYVSVQNDTIAGTATNSVCKIPLVGDYLKAYATLSQTTAAISNSVDVKVIIDRDSE